MKKVAFLVYGLVLAIALALWEIQIEGGAGWAGNLPCWRIENGLIVKILGGRPLTGYHFFLVTFLVLMFHFLFLFTTWKFRKELFVLGFLVGLFLVEDFLWFLLNPEWGIGKFREGMIWWHPTWWGPVPDFYWWFAIIAGILLYFGWSAIKEKRLK